MSNIPPRMWIAAAQIKKTENRKLTAKIVLLWGFAFYLLDNTRSVYP